MELLQQRMWLLEEELEVRNRSHQILQQLLPECQQKEREHLEFRKSIGEEQMARAQKSVSRKSPQKSQSPTHVWVIAGFCCLCSCLFRLLHRCSTKYTAVVLFIFSAKK